MRDYKKRVSTVLFLSDAVERADELLIGSDGTAGQQIEDEGDDGQHGGPLGSELNSAPRLIAGHLAYDEEAYVPSHDKQSVERTEEGLRLAVVEDEDGIGAKGCSRQENSHEGPHVEMMLADGIGEPEVVDPRHINASEIEGTNLHTQTNDRQNDGHYQVNGLFTLPHRNGNLTD